MGYYEFVYGEVDNKKDIYYTFYSDNKKYKNIFNENSFYRSR